MSDFIHTPVDASLSLIRPLNALVVFDTPEIIKGAIMVRRAR